MKIYHNLLFIGIFLLSCRGEKDNYSIPQYNSSVIENKIDSLYNAYYPKDGPAAAIMLMYDGKEIFKNTYGLRNIEKGEKADNKTNFRSGSLAKQFTDLAILNLVEEGKIKLTDTIFQYFPYPIFQNVTISQLISHTSGIEDAEGVFEQNWKSASYVRANDIMDWYKNNTIKRFEPGTQFEYNNATYYVLVQIVEMKSGIPFSEYMKNVVFDKIGMKNTYYVNDQNIKSIPYMAACYEKDSLGNWVMNKDQQLDILVGAGGLYTNLDDYAIYLDALRNHQILDETSHQLIFKSISMDTELHSEDMQKLKGVKSSYAMGWEVTDSLAVSAGLYYGVNNWCIFNLNRPLSLIILTNNNILFQERLVDKTYAIIEDYYKTTANNGYK